MDSTNQPEPVPSSAKTAETILRTYLNEQSEELLRVIRTYVFKCGAAGDERVNDVASEILNEVTLRVLTEPTRFDPARPPRSWLLRIALNVVRQRREALHKGKTEPLSAQFDPERDDSIIDTFDRLAYRASHAVGDASARLDDLLDGATAEERELLQYIDLYGWHYSDLALQMGMTEAAVRKRHQRAIQRLHQLASQKRGQPE